MNGLKLQERDYKASQDSLLCLQDVDAYQELFQLSACHHLRSKQTGSHRQCGFGFGFGFGFD